MTEEKLSRHLQSSIALLDKSVSVSTTNNISKDIKNKRSVSLSLSLSNEQKGRLPCGSSSKKARLPRQHSISPPLRASPNTGQEAEVSFASARDVPIAFKAFPDDGDIKPCFLLTEPQPIGSLGSRLW
ncbi:MAG: hypothetical protein CO103_07055 [Chloroflexi bacterium CG_4_9_14_3_um_filter_45_9]|nr:MAG: hypothetical protein CO103_07055 [Chloroflexi bacterium CG_4_9_14_3_um_filter_45_9]